MIERLLSRFPAYRALQLRVLALESLLAKYEDQASAATLTVHELSRELEIERTRRVAAEAIASERRQEIDRLLGAVSAAERARDEAVAQRLASLDLVNRKLLERPVDPPVPRMEPITAPHVDTAREKMRATDQALREWQLKGSPRKQGA